MADELYISTRVDTSGLASGMSQAQAIVTASLDQLKAQYNSAAATVKTATQNMAQAEQYFATMAQQGNQQAAAALKQYETELAQAKAAEQSAAAAVEEYNAALLQQTASATAATEAQTALNTAAVHTVPQMAAASASIRVFEGALPIRAVERFLTTTLGLGPVLQAAFPIVGAIAFGEMLAQIVEKVIEWKDHLEEIKELNATIGKEIEDQGKKAAELARNAQDAALRLTGITRGPEAEAQAKMGLLGAAVEKDKQNITDLQTALKNMQDRAAAIKAAAGPQLVTFPGGGQAYTMPKQVDTAALDAAQNRITEIVASLQVARAQLTSDMTQMAVETATAAKDATKTAEEEQRKRVDALRRADAEQLSEIRAHAAMQGVTGLALLNQEREFLAQRLAAEQQYADRVREIRIELNRIAVESAGEFARGQKLAQEALRQGVAEADAYQKALARGAEEERRLYENQLKDQTRALQEQLTVTEGFYKADSEQKIGALELDRLAVDRRYALGIEDTRAQIDRLERQRAIDDQIFAEKLRTARALAEVDQLTDPKKYAADLERIAALEAQNNARRYQQTTQILTLQERSYRQFFSQIESGFQNALNGMLRGQQSFAAGLAQMWNDMVLDFADALLRMGIKWAEMELLKLVLSRSAAAQHIAIANEVDLHQKLIDAKSAARGAWDATVRIPYIGPILAPIAAATSFAAVMAFAKGGIVPDTGLVLAHGGEAVLPQPLTTMLTNVANHGGNTQSIHVHYAPTITGTGSGNMKQLLSDHADHLGRIMRDQARRYNRGMA